MRWDDPEGNDSERDDSPESTQEAAGELSAAPVEVEQLAARMLHGLGLDVEVSARDGEESVDVDVDGPDREFLLARRGEALNALQYLLNRIVYRGRRGKKIHVDSAGFRRVREDEIVEIAMRTAEKVRAKGEECVMSPLNPYERRLVHLALSEVEGVATRSIGDGFLKKIAVYPNREPGNE